MSTEPGTRRNSSTNPDAAPVQPHPKAAEWEAARQRVLEHLRTSKDIVSMPISKPPRGGGNTGGRRGRGGARRPKIKIEPASGDSIPTLATMTPTRGRTVNRGGRPRGSRAGASSARSVNRGGRPRGSKAGLLSATSRRTIKRKRKNVSDDDEADDTDASEEINLPTLSSSGRRITQASNTFFTPITIPDESAPSSSPKKPRLSTNTTASPYHPSPLSQTSATPTMSTSKRPGSKNRPSTTSATVSQSAVCKNCGRGHSPQSNQIVFCDTCNTAWHQYCHDRPITPSVVLEEEKEWHCADCQTIAEMERVAQGRVSVSELALLAPGGRAGVEKGMKWKREYLLGLEKEVLVLLLLDAERGWREREAEAEAEAGLKLFEPPGYAAVAARRRGAVEAAGKVVEGLETVAEKSAAAAATVADLEEDANEEPLPYPKMGNGLVLPPELDDLDFMVDDGSTFSHSWQEGGRWRGPLGERGIGRGLVMDMGLGMGVMGGGVPIRVGA